MDTIVGEYVCSKYIGTEQENGYHRVKVEIVPTEAAAENVSKFFSRKQQLSYSFRWITEAGASWALAIPPSSSPYRFKKDVDFKDGKPSFLLVSSDCPYYSKGYTRCDVEWSSHDAASTASSHVVALHGPWNERFDKIIEGKNNASLYANQGNYEMAITLHKPLLERLDATVGPYHPSAIKVMNELDGYAVAYFKKSGKSVPCRRTVLSVLEQGLERKRSIYGNDHPDTISGMHNLAYIYMYTNSLAKAEPLMKQCLAKSKKIFGEDDSRTLASLDNLAQMEFKLDDVDAAERLYLECLTTKRKILGTDHPYTAITLFNLGMLYYRIGDTDHGQSLFDECYAIRKKVLGKDHPSTKYVQSWPHTFLSVAADKANVKQKKEISKPASPVDEDFSRFQQVAQGYQDGKHQEDGEGEYQCCIIQVVHPNGQTSNIPGKLNFEGDAWYTYGRSAVPCHNPKDVKALTAKLLPRNSPRPSKSHGHEYLDGGEKRLLWAGVAVDTPHGNIPCKISQNNRCYFSWGNTMQTWTRFRYLGEEDTYSSRDSEYCIEEADDDEDVNGNVAPQHEFSVGQLVTTYRGGGVTTFPGTVGKCREDGTYDIVYDNEEAGWETGLSRAYIRPRKTMNDDADSPTVESASSSAAIRGGISDPNVEGSRSSKLFLGQLVEAPWRGSVDYRPGKIVNCTDDGKYDIDYDDGNWENGVGRVYIRTRSESGAVGAREVSTGQNEFVIVGAKQEEPFQTTLSIGQLVDARWRKGAHWYSGRIAHATEDGLYDIQYDDGDRENGVARAFIRVRNDGSFDEVFSVGQLIEAQWQGGARWYAGKVANRRNDGRYDIQYDDGDWENGVSPSLIQRRQRHETSMQSSSVHTEEMNLQRVVEVGQIALENLKWLIMGCPDAVEDLEAAGQLSLAELELIEEQFREAVQEGIENPQPQVSAASEVVLESIRIKLRGKRREEFLTMCREDGQCLEGAPGEFIDDKELVLAACSNYGPALEWATNRLQADRDVVLAAFRNNLLSLRYADKKLFGSQDYLLEICTINGCALQYAPYNFRDDKKFILEVCV